MRILTRPAGLWAGLTAALLLAWELTTSAGWVSAIVLPPPAAVLEALASDGGRFLDALWLTLAEMVVAIGITWALGLGLGLLAGTSPLLAAISGPLLAAVFAVPLIILYPLLVAWTGIGPSSKVIYGVLTGVVPVALNTLSGLARSDPAYALMARAMGAGRRQVYFRVRLPLALPAILSGLRIGAAFTVIGVLVSEMLASLGGIGYLIAYHQTLFDTGHVYLGIAMALALVLLVYRALSWLERRFGRWRDRQAGS